MVVTESLVEVELVFERRVDYRLQPYTDGFVLSGWVDGESGQFRHWPLGVGWIGTTGDNEVRDVSANGCTLGVVELPDRFQVDEAETDVRVRMRWPKEVTARMHRDGSAARYAVELTSAPATRWVRLAPADAWLGVSESGELCRVVCAGELAEQRRVEVRLEGVRYAASLMADRLLQVEVEPAGVDGWGEDAVGSERESLEAARGRDWLVLGPGGRFQTLEVYGVEEAEPIVVDRAAEHVAAVEGWQSWPADVRATRWRDGDRSVVGVRFGDGDPDRWSRLGAALWVGMTTDGEITRLVFTDVEESAGAPEHDDDTDLEPGELPGRARLVEQAASARLVIYGLVGQLGTQSGFSTGRGGVPSALSMRFGDDADDGWVSVTSSREPDLDLARSNAASDLVPPGEPPDDHARSAIEAYFAQKRERNERVEAEVLAQPWTPVVITVDGVPIEFRHTSYAERWAAISRIDQTTITIVSDGRSPGEVALATISDLAPHVEYAQQRHREHIEHQLAEHGISGEQYRPTRTPQDKSRRAAVRAVVDELTNALHRNAGAPELASLFTERVVEPWGGRDRYQQFLWLHTMLRPVTGTGSTGDYPRFRDDGSADMRISLTHAAPSARGSHGFVILSATQRGSTGEPEPEPEPDREAIRRGEQHHVTLHLIPDHEQWMIDTDLLDVLIDRLGSIDEVVRPLSVQTGD
jgi:hypothetical protein